MNLLDTWSVRRPMRAVIMLMKSLVQYLDFSDEKICGKKEKVCLPVLIYRINGD